MPTLVTSPYPIYLDEDGQPLEDGYLYIGVEGLNPLTSSQAAYWDSALTVPAANVRTVGGYPSYQGSPGRLYTAKAYSILVMDRARRLVYSSLSSDDWAVALDAEVVHQVATIAGLRAMGSNAAGYTVQVLGYYATGDGGGGPVRRWVSGAAPGTYVDNGGSIIVPTGGDGSAAWLWDHAGPVSVKWYGAYGDYPVHDDTSAIQAAINDPAVSDIYFPYALYKITGTVTLKSSLSIDLQNSTVYSTSLVASAFQITHAISGPFYRVEIRNGSIHAPAAIANPGVYGINIVGGAAASASWIKLVNLQVYQFYCGVHLGDIILSTLDQVHCISNTSDGFFLEGVMTSTKFSNCWGQLSGGSGYHFYGAMAYLSMDACAADNNAGQGYWFEADVVAPTGATIAVALNGCGAEGNGTDGFRLEHALGVTLSGCYAYSHAAGAGFHFVGSWNCSLFGGAAWTNLRGIQTSVSALPQSPNANVAIGVDVQTNTTAYSIVASGGPEPSLIVLGDGRNKRHTQHSWATSEHIANPTYGALITIDVTLANCHVITVTNNNPFTIGPPGSAPIGQRITIRLRNQIGGAMGAVTWDPVYKMAAWVSPASPFSRSIDFWYNGTNWVESNRSAADIPN